MSAWKSLMLDERAVRDWAAGESGLRVVPWIVGGDGRARRAWMAAEDCLPVAAEKKMDCGEEDIAARWCCWAVVVI